MTAPEEGLWDHFGKVTAEDVRHMRSRFEAFRCYAKITNFADVDPCAVHMCRWIVEGAHTADADAALRGNPQPVLPEAVPEAARAGAGGAAAPAHVTVGGLAWLVQAAKLPEGALSALHAELEALGAAHVSELELEDWEGMATFQALKKFEQRRLLKAVRPA